MKGLTMTGKRKKNLKAVSFPRPKRLRKAAKKTVRKELESSVVDTKMIIPAGSIPVKSELESTKRKLGLK